MKTSYKLPINYNSLSSVGKKIVRTQYVIEQNNFCWYCNGLLDRNPPKHILDLKLNLKLFPKGFLQHPIHLHHSHKTGLTIGAVHSYCNGVLWQYKGQ